MLQQFTKMSVVRTITAIAVAGGLAISTAIAAPLDENIATSYTILDTSINWQTSGALQPSSAGTLGPFKRVCATVEGQPVTRGNTLKRAVYVLDAGDGSANSFVLHIYARTDTITSSNGQISDTETVVPHHKVVLSESSASAATCFMAANSTSVFAANSANDQASVVDKISFAEIVIQSYVAGIAAPVTNISAAASGLIFVTFGTGSSAGFAEFDDQSKYLAAGQHFNYTVLAGTENSTAF